MHIVFWILHVSPPVTFASSIHFSFYVWEHVNWTFPFCCWVLLDFTLPDAWLSSLSERLWDLVLGWTSRYLFLCVFHAFLQVVNVVCLKTREMDLSGFHHCKRDSGICFEVEYPFLHWNFWTLASSIWCSL